MKIGAFYFPTDYGIDIIDIISRCAGKSTRGVAQ